MMDIPFPVPISQFTGHYAFLGSFWLHPIIFEGIEYRSNEHAFHAAKTLDTSLKRWIAAAPTPGIAKQRGRTIPLRPFWDVCERYRVMQALLALKFYPWTHLANSLLETETSILIEGNTWHDRTWGVCFCAQCGGVGHNILGWMLMQRREQLTQSARETAAGFRP